METQYAQFKDMIHAFAWKYARSSNMPVEDILSEAHLIFCESVQCFNPELASFGTHLFTRLSGKLKHFIDKEKLHGTRYFAEPKNSVGDQLLDSASNAFLDNCSETRSLMDFQFDVIDLNEFLKTTSLDARTLVKWYFDGDLRPTYSKDPEPVALKSWSVFMRFARTKGWPWKRTQEAFDELVECMTIYRALA